MNNAKVKRGTDTRDIQASVSASLAELVSIVKAITNQSTASDGEMVIGTLWWEALERAVHNLEPAYLPEHPDSEVMPVRFTAATIARRTITRWGVSNG